MSDPFTLASFRLEITTGIADLLFLLGPRRAHRSTHIVLGAVGRIGPNAFTFLGAHFVGRSSLSLLVGLFHRLVLFVGARRTDFGGRHHAWVVLEHRFHGSDEREVALAAEFACEVVQVDRPEHGACKFLFYDVLGFDFHRFHVVVAGPWEVLFAFCVWY